MAQQATTTSITTPPATTTALPTNTAITATALVRVSWRTARITLRVGLTEARPHVDVSEHRRKSAELAATR